MKLSAVWLVLTGLALIAPANAETPQQQKMKSCNTEATSKGLKSDERKIFMSQCLSSQGAASPLTPQQDKMKQCNADAKAKGIKGPDRKTFMSACLSQGPAPVGPSTPAP